MMKKQVRGQSKRLGVEKIQPWEAPGQVFIQQVEVEVDMGEVGGQST